VKWVETCEPQGVAGLGPRRPRRAVKWVETCEPQDVAGLGSRRPRRAVKWVETCEPQHGLGLDVGEPPDPIREVRQDVEGASRYRLAPSCVRAGR
jgi:hypothetical protein